MTPRKRTPRDYHPREVITVNRTNLATDGTLSCNGHMSPILATRDHADASLSQLGPLGICLSDTVWQDTDGLVWCTTAVAHMCVCDDATCDHPRAILATTDPLTEGQAEHLRRCSNPWCEACNTYIRLRDHAATA